MNNLIDKARHLPIREPAVTISVSPVLLPAPDRGMPIEMRITAPATGRDLPVVLLSHGHGPSLYIPSKDGYGPLVNFYAEQGFAVIQPTHANSKVAGFPSDAPGAPLFWRARVEEMRLILDQLDAIEAMVPAIAGRIDRERIAAVGHSMGGQTVGMLLGARLTDPNDEIASDVNLFEPRIKVGVLLAAPGNGGKDLSDYAAAHYSALNPDFTHMTTRALVVSGDSDVNPHLTVRGADWHEDPYRIGPGADALLTLFGGKHGLGGVAGYDAKETDDENPDRLAVTQRMTSAYLRSALYDGDPAWTAACAALAEHASGVARVERK
ncbi:MAG: dienelactone hydrolase [Bauldia sp.]|nr:dienelactone hydrolase [Bauldia sp.]